jgi:hypothetical protein
MTRTPCNENVDYMNSIVIQCSNIENQYSLASKERNASGRHGRGRWVNVCLVPTHTHDRCGLSDQPHLLSTTHPTAANSIEEPQTLQPMLFGVNDIWNMPDFYKKLFVIANTHSLCFSGCSSYLSFRRYRVWTMGLLYFYFSVNWDSFSCIVL